MSDDTKPPKRKMTGVRLSVTAQELLAGVLRDHYGLNSTTAIIETLIREKARELAARQADLAPVGAKPRSECGSQPTFAAPLTQMVSPDASEDDADEADSKRFSSLKAEIFKAELDRQ